MQSTELINLLQLPALIGSKRDGKSRQTNYFGDNWKCCQIIIFPKNNVGLETQLFENFKK